MVCGRWRFFILLLRIWLPRIELPEFSPESASSAPESGVTRTGSPEAVMRKRVLLRSGMRCTVSPSSSCIVQMSSAERSMR